MLLYLTLHFLKLAFYINFLNHKYHITINSNLDFSIAIFIILTHGLFYIKMIPRIFLY